MSNKDTIVFETNTSSVYSVDYGNVEYGDITITFEGEPLDMDDIISFETMNVEPIYEVSANPVYEITIEPDMEK